MFGRSSGKIDLPSMPATLARIIEITNDPESSSDQLAGVVLLDQSLSTKVLRLANSAYFCRRKKAETVTEAVTTLGFGSVRNLAASASVVDALFPKRVFAGFSWYDMWIHSVTCAIGSEAIHRRISGSLRSNESAFVAGLLHDIGKLVIARALPGRFIQIVEACREYGFEMVRAETNYLSTNHSSIGSDLAAQWQFPDKLIAAIAYHHKPEAAGDDEDLARAVGAANLLAKRLSKSYIIGLNETISLKDIADAAGINPKDMDYIVNDVREGLKQCDEILSWGAHLPGSQMAA
jgi:putative nucleotidyltransferase with HDIG domain